MATKFATAFYEALIAGRKTVAQAFKNSKAELLLSESEDCCCRHMGHVEDCICAICKRPRCCGRHHAKAIPGTGHKCAVCAFKPKMLCCQPNVPHSHAEKFLLL